MAFPTDVRAKLSSGGNCVFSTHTHWVTTTHSRGLPPTPRFRPYLGATQTAYTHPIRPNDFSFYVRSCVMTLSTRALKGRGTGDAQAHWSWHSRAGARSGESVASVRGRRIRRRTGRKGIAAMSRKVPCCHRGQRSRVIVKTRLSNLAQLQRGEAGACGPSEDVKSAFICPIRRPRG